MRDTLQLRHRLALLACLPLLAPSCDSTPGPSKSAPSGSPPDRNPAPRAEAPRAASNGAQRAAARARPGSSSTSAPSTTASADEQRFAPIPGDPPWIDGYNPEEAPCPSGNWCGTVETATAIAPNRGDTEVELDCPIRINGSRQPNPINPEAYAGLSPKRSMQGAFNRHGTELARADGKPDACCYHWFEYCSGRPWVDDRRALRATARAGNGWSSPVATASVPAEAGVRAALAQAWLSDALDEHASVASFARATLELLAVGAPATLVVDTQRASLDEVDHAQRCFSLARRFGATTAAPGPLPALAPRPTSLATLARNTFVEGCIGETIAALVAQRAAHAATDPQTRATLETIAEDEARHAALAWRTVAWALGEDPVGVTAALRDLPDPTPPAEPETTAPDLSDWGRLGPQQRRAAASQARRDIVQPMLEALLASAAPLRGQGRPQPQNHDTRTS